MAESPLLASLRRAVESAPEDLPLRLHLAGLLVDEGLTDQAVGHLGTVLSREPGSPQALELMRRALGAGASAAAAAAPAAPVAPVAPVAAPEPGPAPASPDGFDWNAAARDLGELAEPLFVGPAAGSGESDAPAGSAYEVEDVGVRLSDVGGMEEVKRRLDVAFLKPMRNPELSRMYRKSLRGGLLLYGPPGCGKTFVARAVAGELGAKFFSVTLADVIDMYIGQSERNLAAVFDTARRNSPCVLFFDEIDALGRKRGNLRTDANRGVVNQFLTELDSVDAVNDGVFVLGATNTPWDVDTALRRPGRLDRTLLVAPPDRPAREAILRYHLQDRPVSRIDVAALAKRTEGYSGADLAHVCETAAETALLAAAEEGTLRLIGMADLEAAIDEVRPSIGPWLEEARNVVLFANSSGAYDELHAYMKKNRLL
ncbi:AAA family ATPase [Actinospica robiniae]|uniref:AAA family ATPase n=1 Tax=Actinospica robiniae TaxID=304901 RepID=UPI0003F58C92|nr:AAA family ATPase [Actinospica robiniae]